MEYCTTCGKKLIRNKYINGYDRETGKANEGYVLRCPGFLATLLGHTYECYDKNGKLLIEHY